MVSELVFLAMFIALPDLTFTFNGKQFSTTTTYIRDNFFYPCINLPFARGLYLFFEIFLLN